MIETVIFLPFAGGTKYSYRGYLNALPAHINPVFVEYPGRGNRAEEAFCSSIDDLVIDAYHQVAPHLKGNYVIYGHSMGSLVGFLLAGLIKEKEHPLPRFLYFTGCRSPSAIEKRNEALHSQSPQLFWKHIFDFGGMPREIIENDDLRGMIEPVLRSDFKMIETYMHSHNNMIDNHILVINGDRENVTTEEEEAWCEVTYGDVHLKKAEGKHFFIFGKEKLIIDEMLQFYSSLC